MRKHILITIILLIATAFITVVYFKNLNPPGMRTGKIMRTIPNDAAFIFEFNNDQSFYDIFKDNQLISAVAGKQKIGELDTLRSVLLLNPLLQPYFAGQNIFVSMHPAKDGDINLLLTISASNGLELSVFNALTKQAHSGVIVTPFSSNGKKGYDIYIGELKKRFYIINKDENIFLGSFSKDLIDQCSTSTNKLDKMAAVQLSEQQIANSLANLYVNYSALSPLFEHFFKDKNTDILRSLRALPALGALSINYRSDALMFNGLTKIQQNDTASYLNLFAGQQPMINHLKDIFPSTTAYSINFTVSDQLKFGEDLSEWHKSPALKDEEEKLFKKIKAETGINFKAPFMKLLGNEFAIITTRYLEKLAIISVKDGSKMKLLLSGISTSNNENSSQFSYERVPFFLLGDSFNILKRPYFIVIDNYLILANTPGELVSFSDTYLNRKFLSKNVQYNQFNNLLSEKSNVSFLFQFKNLQPILKIDLKDEVFSVFDKMEPGWKDFYAASIQYSATDKNFYTNFCLKLNTDTLAIVKLK